MKVVTIEEARENMPELLRLVARGTQVVIADGGKWVAALTPPPAPPPTPEEIAAAQARARESVKAMVRQQIADGYTPHPESEVWQLFEAGELPQ